MFFRCVSALNYSRHHHHHRHRHRTPREKSTHLVLLCLFVTEDAVKIGGGGCEMPAARRIKAGAAGLSRMQFNARARRNRALFNPRRRRRCVLHARIIRLSDTLSFNNVPERAVFPTKTSPLSHLSLSLSPSPLSSDHRGNYDPRLRPRSRAPRRFCDCSLHAHSSLSRAPFLLEYNAAAATQ